MCISISDSTGETVTTVARAAVSQFEDVVPVEHVWFFVRTRQQLEKVLAIVEALPGLVIFTLASPELRHVLQERCLALSVPCVPVLDSVMNALAGLLGSAGRPQIGRQHALDEGYFPRIAAIDFAMRHDDGQVLEDLESWPTWCWSACRAPRRRRPASISPIEGSRPPTCRSCPRRPQLDGLAKLQRPLIVGLTINPESAGANPSHPADDAGRWSRAITSRYGGDYADVDRIRGELVLARRLFARHNWPEIDVTKRSVEETAAAIYQMIQARRQPELKALGAVLPNPGWTGELA